MIPYAELERALARWKARKEHDTGDVPDASFPEDQPGVALRLGHGAAAAYGQAEVGAAPWAINGAHGGAADFDQGSPAEYSLSASDGVNGLSDQQPPWGGEATAAGEETWASPLDPEPSADEAVPQQDAEAAVSADYQLDELSTGELDLAEVDGEDSDLDRDVDDERKPN